MFEKVEGEGDGDGDGEVKNEVKDNSCRVRFAEPEVNGQNANQKNKNNLNVDEK